MLDMSESVQYLSQYIPTEDRLGVSFMRLERLGSIEVPQPVANISFVDIEDAEVVYSGSIIVPDEIEVKLFGGQAAERTGTVIIEPSLVTLLEGAKKAVLRRYPQGFNCNVFINTEVATDEECRTLQTFGGGLFKDADEPESQDHDYPGMYL